MNLIKLKDCMKKANKRKGKYMMSGIKLNR